MKSVDNILIKSQEEIQILREAGQRLARILEDITRSLKSGMTTRQVDSLAENFIRDHKVLSAFKGYRGFPNCLCLSVNQEVVHGIPGPRVLNEGGLVSIDCGIIHKDYYSDTAVTVGIEKIHPYQQKLIDVTREALYKGIEQAQINNHLSDISHAIQRFVESNHFSVVREFVGHGIGRNLHEEPEIPNYGLPHEGPILKEGMVLAIEPMVNMGTFKTKILEDGWTVVTEDGQPSAHFEHSIVITEKGPEILTRVS